MKFHNESGPFFITEEAETEVTAAGYEFAPPGHARTASIRELFGSQPDETLFEAVSKYLEKASTASGREPIGDGV